IATVDAVNGDATLDAHVEAVKQVAMADRLVITKTDLIEEKDILDALRQRLKGLNTGAALLDAVDDKARAAVLFDCGLYNPATKSADVRRWLGEEAAHDHDAHDHAGHHHRGGHDHHHRHDARVRSDTLVHGGPV